jgi:PAS domain S-box-containing protein
MNEKPKSYVWYTKLNVLLLTISVIFIFTSGIAFIVSYQHYQHAVGYALTSNKTTASLVSDIIVEHQKAAIGVLQSYASRPSFVNAVKERDFRKVLFHLTQLKKSNNEIDEPFVSDKNGVLLFNYPVDKVSHGKNLSYRDWYKGVSKKWRPYASGVFRLIIGEKELAVAVCVPVFDQKGRVVGILGSSQRVSFLSNIIKQAPLDKYTKVTLVDQTGYIIYSNKFPYERETSSYPSFPLIQKAIQEHKDLIEMKDPKEGGRKSYVTLALLKDIGWTVIFERTDKDVFRSEYKYFALSAIISFLFFLLISSFLVYLRKDFMFRKTTEQLQIEKELREEEERFRELFENISSGVAVYNAVNDGEDFVFTGFNKAGEKIDSISREQLIGKSVLKMFPGIKEFGLFEVFQRVYKTGKSEKHSAGFYQDQRLSGWRDNYVYKLPSGEIVAIYDDITERLSAEQAGKQAEEALKESKEKYHSIFENAMEGIFQTTPEGRYISVNPALAKILGFETSEEMIKNVTDIGSQLYANPEDRVKFIKLLEKQGSVKNCEIQAYRKDGSKIWVVTNARAVRDANGAMLYYEGSIEDITEHKHMVEELKLSNERFHIVARATNDAIWDWCLPTNAVWWSEVFQTLFGYSADEIEPGIESWYNRLHPDDRDKTVSGIHAIIDGGGKYWSDEYRFRCKDGSYAYIFDRGFILHDDQGMPVRMIGSMMDISKRREAEEQITKSLREKEVLLREIHHRVKNNIQVISSLLFLQSRRIKDKQATEIFEESQNMIKTMALIHDKLYKSKDLASINMKEYINDLMKDLFRFYKVNPDKITLATEIEDVSLGIDSAINCGLIINELVSNSLKYAFPSLGAESREQRAESSGTGQPYRERKGEITITLTENSYDSPLYAPRSSLITLTVQDNGIGIPDDVDLRSTNTLGLQLVAILVENNLKGEIRLDKTHGTGFHIKFVGIKP